MQVPGTHTVDLDSERQIIMMLLAQGQNTFDDSDPSVRALVTFSPTPDFSAICLRRPRDVDFSNVTQPPRKKPVLFFVCLQDGFYLGLFSLTNPNLHVCFQLQGNVE